MHVFLIVRGLNSFLGKMETSYNCYKDDDNTASSPPPPSPFLELLSVPGTMLDTLQISSVTLIPTSKGDFMNLKLGTKAQRDEVVFSKSQKQGASFSHL